MQDLTFATWGLIAGTILFLAGGGYVLFGYLDKLGSSTPFISVVFATVVCFAGLITIGSSASIYRDANMYTDYQAKIANGYVCYIDGQEVDGTKLDPAQYRTTVNDEKKEIYLTK